MLTKLSFVGDGCSCDCYCRRTTTATERRLLTARKPTPPPSTSRGKCHCRSTVAASVVRFQPRPSRPSRALCTSRTAACSWSVQAAPYGANRTSTVDRCCFNGALCVSAMMRSCCRTQVAACGCASRCVRSTFFLELIFFLNLLRFGMMKRSI